MTMTNPQKTAWVKAMDYLARRDHSEKELIEKLSRFFPWEEIEPVLQELKDRGWLLDPQELAAKVTESLHRKNKGYHYIQHFLRKKGLPGTAKDSEREWNKARELIETKRKPSDNPKRMVSLLKNRGFDTETISRVIHEIHRNSPSLY
jgi:regulatory protein